MSESPAAPLLEVASIAPMKRRPGMQLVTFTDGTSAMIHEETTARGAIAVGRRFGAAEWATLWMEDQRTRCRAAAWRLLSLRPRSDAELRRALTTKGFAASIVTEVMDHLGQRGFVDDAGYARVYTEGAVRRRKGRRMVEQELSRKGISREVAREALDSAADPERDRESMRELLRRWDRPSRSPDPRKRAASAAAMLARRGFDATTVWEVVREHFRAHGVDPAEE